MKTTKLLFVLGLMLAFSQVFSQKSTEGLEGKTFSIQSAMNYGHNNGGYWDIPGDPTHIQKGSNIQVWNLNNGVDRKYTLLRSPQSGFYEIFVGNTRNSRVDIAGGGSKNGTNVGVWENNGGHNQRFRFQHLGNGRFKIFDSNGKVICLDGRNNANGSNVHIWDDQNGSWMEWYLISERTGEAFIPQTASKTPDFFIKNKFFNYIGKSLGGGSVDGKANVEKIEGNKIFVRNEGVSHNSDVAPGQPTERAFNYVLEITYENGKYLYAPDIYNPGEISDDGQTLSFSGDAYLELVVTQAPLEPTATRAPSELGGWIRNLNSHTLTIYLSRVSYADLVSDDDGIIVTEVSKLIASKQPTFIVEMISGAESNDDAKVRKHVYTQLSKVTHKRASGLIRMAINAGFPNFINKEPVKELKDILQDIQRKISNAK